MYPRKNPLGCQHLELGGSKSSQGFCHGRHIPQFLVQRLQLLRRKRRTALSYKPLTKSRFITQWCKMQIETSAHGSLNSDPSVKFHWLRTAFLQFMERGVNVYQIHVIQAAKIRRVCCLVYFTLWPWVAECMGVIPTCWLIISNSVGWVPAAQSAEEFF